MTDTLTPVASSPPVVPGRRYDPGSWLPGPRLITAEVLKLRRRKGVMIAAAELTSGAVVIIFAIRFILHLTSPGQNGPAGGLGAFGNVSFALSELGSIAAILIGAAAGASDLDAGVFRNLVSTGRSRLALFGARIPAGLAVLVPVVAAAVALTSVAAVGLAGGLPAPSVGMMIQTGLWVELDVVMTFLVALGLSSLIGSRSTTVALLLALQLVATPIVLRLHQLSDVRQLLLGTPLSELRPGSDPLMDSGAGFIMTGTSIAVVLVLWVVVPLGVGAWKTARRDA
jgi:ABC-type transport system involved in multi-copper enzyme maturation permease subunit